MKIENVIEFISQNVPLKLYANEFPKTDNGDCGFVRFNDGEPPDLYIVGLYSPSIQIVIRQDSGQEADKVSTEIWKLFHAKEHFFIGDSKVFISMCDQSTPVYVGRDNNDRTLYSVNVSMKVMNSTL